MTTILGTGGADRKVGTSSDDVITLYSGNDTAYARDGNDTVFGNAGADELHGGNGDDQLYGMVGNDRLYGGAGNDVLNGGSGQDKLWGDTGDDTFYLDGGETVWTGSGADQLSLGITETSQAAPILIADFQHGYDQLEIIERHPADDPSFWTVWDSNRDGTIDGQDAGVTVAPASLQGHSALSLTLAHSGEAPTFAVTFWNLTELSTSDLTNFYGAS